MKRAVKLQRRELKKEIKRLTEEIGKLKYKNMQMAFMRPPQVCVPIGYSKVLNDLFTEQPDYMEAAEKRACEDIAFKLGKFILENDLCEIKKCDSLLGGTILSAKVLVVQPEYGSPVYSRLGIGGDDNDGV